jgi:tRNA(Ile)-lysidine synthetase-like protein
MATVLPTTTILNYWFQNTNTDGMNKFWFDKSCDTYITEHFKEPVDNINYDNYLSYITKTDDMISLLIVGDQFTRNIYRDTEHRTKNDKWALKLALYMIEENLDLTVPLNHRYFILLPLRHNKTSMLLDIVCNRIKIYIKQYTEQNLDIPMSLIKFYNNTIQNYTYLTDTIILSNPSENMIYKDSFNTVLEQKVEKIDSYPPKIDSLRDSIKKFPYNNIANSLSGGVDSMVLQDLLKLDGKKVVAIHVEHCNRVEAKIEREFLEYYCAINEIPLYYRTISYINRDNDFLDRNLFEEETKKARFNLYKYVIEKENLDGVCMGHHMGDIVENVFTNIIKGRDTNDLMVMREMQEMMGVTIFRPLLKHMKDSIFEYAYYYKKSFFKNTTPPWSCRGVMRDTVIPTLKQQFGDFENNIIKFAEKYMHNSNFYESEMDKLIKIEHRELYSKLEYNMTIYDVIKDNIHKIFLNFMHSNGYHMVSNKSVNNFLIWLGGKKDNIIYISKDVLCYYNNNIIYIVNHTKIIDMKISKDILHTMFDNYLPSKLQKIILF